MSEIWNTSNIKLGHPKKIPSTKPLIARRIEVPNPLSCNWRKVSRTFPLLKPKAKGNRFIW